LRTIVKRPQPDALTRWRQPRLAADKPEGMECSYAELRRNNDAINAVEDALFSEQGGICAYTGLSLSPTLEREGVPRKVGFHCEHLKSQDRCRKLDGAVYGEDADYGKLKGIKLPEAKRLLQQLRAEARRLDAGQDIQLGRFCFVIEQALEREIRKLKGIRDASRAKRQSDKG